MVTYGSKCYVENENRLFFSADRWGKLTTLDNLNKMVIIIVITVTVTVAVAVAIAILFFRLQINKFYKSIRFLFE